MIIVLLPFSIYGSLNYYKDLYIGKIEFKTEIYKIPVESYYENNDIFEALKKYPDRPKEIELSSYHKYCTLTISDEMYNELITKNPLDKTREVYNATFAETTNPHLHHIIIKFYENTKIVDSVQIIYD